MFDFRKSPLDSLINQWVEYRRLALTRLGADNVEAAEERTFLKLKGKIAEGLASLTVDLGQAAAQEAHVHLRAIADLLGRFPTLYSDNPLDQAARVNFEHNWHDHYLFFNKLKGMRGRSDSRDPKPQHVKTDKSSRKGAGVRFGTVLLRLMVVVVTVGALVRFTPWHRLFNGTAKEGAGGFQAFASDAWESIKQVVSNIGPSLGSVFGPAGEKYGPEVTTILVALLLIATGYWIFIRIK